MYNGTLVKETTSALLVDVDGEQVWLPKSTMTYTRRDPPDKDGKVKIAFKLEAWKEKQLGWL